MRDAAVDPRSLEQARAVADAVLYEGYLLYPYRCDARKNQTRWQFGVLGPPEAAERGVGEDAEMRVSCLVRTGGNPRVRVLLRFLQLQRREVELFRNGAWVPAPALTIAKRHYVSWDEAIAHELDLGEISPGRRTILTGHVGAGEDIAELYDGDRVAGRIRRTRWPIHATVTAESPSGHTVILGLGVRNTGPAPRGPSPKTDALRRSLLGAHLLLISSDAEFVSLLEPENQAVDSADAAELATAAKRCTHHRCFPVLAGRAGERRIVLASPIILYDYPEVARESAGSMFDATEIDEILTLRILAMTDEEKALARATDPLAATIIDRADSSTAESLGALHGTIRDIGQVPPGAAEVMSESSESTARPWWDPAADRSVDPESEQVDIAGVSVGKGSLVRVHPARFADAQDLFFKDQVARVTLVQRDVDGGVHIGVVLVDDPAADLHDWFGRYFYFAPSELEPLGDGAIAARKDGET
ncbi:hypothetical protein ONR57_07285 [Hoyosella sp. YIM 151337]|uniref:hypothetical protein n=1 Tax=Hoyosella sp. YIM 151337 TaxID=2992742 RepID=UPI0022364093|nr:hypothetical protein [Hoyosella sp. YIM 151337]MCW4353098.1 hypothetical protein [Hoyosella sp. YIM 151337]